MLAKAVGTVNILLRSAGRPIVSRWSIPWILRRPLADYGFIAKLFREYQLGRLKGDILELGSWLGFGTARLAKLAMPFGKVVHTADWFPVDFSDPTTVTAPSARRYIKLYRGMDQREVFDLNTRRYSNIVVHVGNVTDLTFPPDQRFVCSFIDAGHTYEIVRRCLALTLAHTAPGGLIFFDDYGNPDYPDVQRAVDEFIETNSDAILRVRRKSHRHIIAIVVRGTGDKRTS